MEASSLEGACIQLKFYIEGHIDAFIPMKISRFSLFLDSVFVNLPLHQNVRVTTNDICHTFGNHLQTCAE